MPQTIEQELATRGRSLFQTVGNSMEPLLHNRRSTVVIERKQGRLKTGDVALYRRPAGEYVLHRVVKVLDGAYLICGDNRLWKETVPEEWVIGVMAGYYQTEADDYVPCTEENVRRYLKSIRLRRCRLWLSALPGRVYRKLRNSFSVEKR